MYGLSIELNIEKRTRPIKACTQRGAQIPGFHLAPTMPELYPAVRDFIVSPCLLMTTATRDTEYCSLYVPGRTARLAAAPG